MEKGWFSRDIKSIWCDNCQFLPRNDSTILDIYISVIYFCNNPSKQSIAVITFHFTASNFEV